MASRSLSILALGAAAMMAASSAEAVNTPDKAAPGYNCFFPTSGADGRHPTPAPSI